MHRLLLTGVVLLACTALLGIQQAVALVLRQTTGGGVTTLITMGMALLGLWAIAVLREK